MQQPSRVQPMNPGIGGKFADVQICLKRSFSCGPFLHTFA
jgi:hypothetical protein